ncbi:MAG: hypothetical protein H7144_03605 [Burkholderiales bacterium]|nr:hypothetical protein [Phycisphaerae bacterium]
MSRDPAPESTDILCEECGYLLNGLPDTGNCPECGSPVARSTTQSPRRLPAWEDDTIASGVARFQRTAIPVLLHPRRFFVTLAVREADRRSRKFMLFALALATYLNTKTILVHYAMTALIAPPVEWLPSWLLLLLVMPVAIFAVWWVTLELVAYLSAMEGKYWGYRLDRRHVRRAIQYVSIHIPVASVLPMLTVTGYAIMLGLTRDNGRFMAEYLYVLSGCVVVTAVYLFRVYWLAMRGIMFANPQLPIPSGTHVSVVAPTP